jgi:hypothetical protein
LRDVDDLKDLKRVYLELVRAHGEKVTEFKAFKQALLEMNRRHRREAAMMYVNMISRVEKKTGGKS